VAAPSGRRPGAAASSLLLASAAALLTGCAAGDDIVASMALPAAQSTQAGPPGQAGAPAPPLLSPPGGQPGDLVETDRQRAYLNALVADGVHPSSDLHALSIGSYVCQARAAKQTDQAVWDFVLPLVRSDLDAHVNDGVQIDSMAATASQVDAATTGYIRIATERLC
jgi:hypothetical protein